jgi:hypothetical protein
MSHLSNIAGSGGACTDAWRPRFAAFCDFFFLTAKPPYSSSGLSGDMGAPNPNLGSASSAGTSSPSSRLCSRSVSELRPHGRTKSDIDRRWTSRAATDASNAATLFGKSPTRAVFRIAKT